MPQLKNDLSEDPQVFIAIMSQDITEVKDSLKEAFMRFLGKTVIIHEITDEIKLSEDRKTIINSTEIALKYPKVKYLFVFYQREPQISHHFHTRNETEQIRDKNGNTSIRETGYDILVYVTKFSADCDTILFDLRNNELMAEATDPFTSQAEIERKEIFPDHTLFGFLTDIFFNPKHDLERYPTINSASAFSRHKYFYTFLKKVSNSK